MISNRIHIGCFHLADQLITPFKGLHSNKINFIHVQCTNNLISNISFISPSPIESLE